MFPCDVINPGLLILQTTSFCVCVLCSYKMFSGECKDGEGMEASAGGPGRDRGRDRRGGREGRGNVEERAPTVAQAYVHFRLSCSLCPTDTQTPSGPLKARHKPAAGRGCTGVRERERPRDAGAEREGERSGVRGKERMGMEWRKRSERVSE